MSGSLHRKNSTVTVRTERDKKTKRWMAADMGADLDMFVPTRALLAIVLTPDAKHQHVKASNAEAPVLISLGATA